MPPAGPESVATTIRGLGQGGSRETGDRGALENEIDASLERLELEGPTGTSLPEGIAALSLEETAATRTSPGARSNNHRPSSKPKGVFDASADEVTESGQIVPHTLKEMRDAPRTEVSSATERPMQPTDPSIMGGESESFRAAAPMTAPGGADTSEGVSTAPGDALESGDLMDVEDPTGADMKLDLESTHAGADDIVIADDLAEDATDDTDEHTETGATVPPFRSDS